MMTVDINICNYKPEAYIAFGIVSVEMNQCNYKQEAYIGLVLVIMKQSL
jgi:accessory gene regulator protein AgrB